MSPKLAAASMLSPEVVASIEAELEPLVLGLECILRGMKNTQVIALLLARHCHCCTRVASVVVLQHGGLINDVIKNYVTAKGRILKY